MSLSRVRARREGRERREEASGASASASGKGRAGGQSARSSRNTDYTGWTQQERQALYLGANCRFGVRLGSSRSTTTTVASLNGSTASSSSYSLGFDWDADIVFVEVDVPVCLADALVPETEPSSLRCPISLDVLELPVMTPCGHVFSLVSLVTDMVVVREGRSAPCPMCGVVVGARELKPVRVRVVGRVGRNGVGRWRLVRVGARAGEDGDDWVEVVGKGDVGEGEGDGDGEGDAGVVQPRVRCLDVDGRFRQVREVENPEALWRFYVRRLAARSEEVAVEGGEESGCLYLGYVAAIDVVVDIARRMVDGDGDGERERGTEVVNRLRDEVAGVIASSKGEVARVRRQARLDEEFPSLGGNAAGTGAGAGTGDEEVRCRARRREREGGIRGKKKLGDAAPDESCSFYQSADGQRLFLNALNTEMLRAAGFPPVFDAKVLDLARYEQTVATKTSKRRDAVGFPFRHVPLGASVGVCEVDLSGVVSEDVLAAFRERVEKNREEREQKAMRAFLESQRRQKEALALKQAEVDAVAAMMRSMPRLGVGDGAEEEGAEGERAEEEEEERLPSSSSTPSWAILTKDGFAATGPSLGGSPASVASPPLASSSWGQGGVSAWGVSTGPSPASASWMPDVPLDTAMGSGKGKKKVTLFSSSTARRY